MFPSFTGLNCAPLVPTAICSIKPDPCLTGNSRNAKTLCRTRNLVYRIFQHWNLRNSTDEMESMEAMQPRVQVFCIHLHVFLETMPQFDTSYNTRGVNTFTLFHRKSDRHSRHRELHLTRACILLAPIVYLVRKLVGPALRVKEMTRFNSDT